jgi:cysteine-rich repeat protein
LERHLDCGFLVVMNTLPPSRKIGASRARSGSNPRSSSVLVLVSGALALSLLGACATAASNAEDYDQDPGTDGEAGAAGAEAGGSGGAGKSGSSGKGGSAGAGGSAGKGGTGGSAGKGGAAGTGGSAGKGGGGSGGAAGKGGSAGSSGKGGAAGAGGTAGKGGSAGSGGTSGKGGASGASGTAGIGGASGAAGDGGASGGGGSVGGGAAGASGAAGSGGAAGDAGAAGAGGSGGSPSVVCGDGVLGAGEECDDGNTSNGDWCNKQCQVTCKYGSKYGTHCYEFTFSSFSWTSGQSYCVSRNPGFGHLVTFDELTSSDEIPEETWVLGQYPNDLDSFWIGYTDSVMEGSFRRWDGSVPVYNRWWSGEPNDSGGEDCVEEDAKCVNSDLFGCLQYGWAWNDNKCSASRPVVCEYEPYVLQP